MVLALLKLKDARVRERLVPEKLRVGGVRQARVLVHELGERAVGVAVHGAHGDDAGPEIVRALVPGGKRHREVERVLDRCAAVGREIPDGVSEVLAELGVGLPWARAWKGGAVH